MTKNNLYQKVIIGGTVFVLLFLSITSCSKKSTDTPVVEKNNITLDLADAKYSDLLSVGGTYVIDTVKIIISHTENFNKRYVAASSQCTYESATLTYCWTSAAYWKCPTCLSEFSWNGSVMNGPAGVAIKTYFVTVTGNILTVHRQ